MSKSVNKVILLGNLGKNPELRYTGSGTAVASFSIATNEGYKDQDGNWVDKTEWHNLVAWKKLAEVCGQYLQKGSKVMIIGKLQTRSYDDKNGVRRYTTEVVISELVMLDSREKQDDQESPAHQDTDDPADGLPF